jgi:hypothetical protein
VPRNILRALGQPDMQLFQFAILQSVDTNSETFLTVGILASSSSSATGWSGNTSPRLLNYVLTVAKDVETANLRFSYAHGPWSAEEIYDLSSTEGPPVSPKDATLKLISKSDDGKKTSIRIAKDRTNLPENLQEMMRVRTTDGREVNVESSSGNALAGYNDYTFPVPRDQITALIFKYRSMETVDLQNVSLVPGVKTEIVIRPGSAPASKGARTKPPSAL